MYLFTDMADVRWMAGVALLPLVLLISLCFSSLRLIIRRSAVVSCADSVFSVRIY